MKGESITSGSGHLFTEIEVALSIKKGTVPTHSVAISSKRRPGYLYYLLKVKHLCGYVLLF